MRVLSYILIGIGIYLLVSAGYDEFRGITTKPLPFRVQQYYHYGYLYSLPVSRGNHPKLLNNPKLFREFMMTHWIYAFLVEAAGCILFVITKQIDDI
jgi:hypothetical protein